MQFERSLIRLRRRRMAQRLADGAAVGLAVGCGMVMGGSAAAWVGRNRLGYPAGGWALALAALAVAAVIGGTLAFWRRATLSQVAIEVDRALGSRELFLTALHARRVVGAGAKADAWASAVVSEAQGRAPELESAHVIEAVAGGRIGVRGWGAVVILAAAVLVGSAWMGRMASGGGAWGGGADQARAVTADSGAAVVRLAVATPPSAGGIEPADEFAGRAIGASRAPVDQPAKTDTSARGSAAAAANKSSAANGAPGAGPGQARTAVAMAGLPEARPIADGASADARAAGALGSAGGGPAAKVAGASAHGARVPVALVGANPAHSGLRIIDNPFYLSGSAPNAAAGAARDSGDDGDLQRDFFSTTQP